VPTASPRGSTCRRGSDGATVAGVGGATGDGVVTTLVIVEATPAGSVATAGGLDDAGIVVLRVAGAPTSGTGGDDHGEVHPEQWTPS
jgi:hypothetical protein